jgi:hypothetical protein
MHAAVLKQQVDSEDEFAVARIARAQQPGGQKLSGGLRARILDRPAKLRIG